MPTYQELRPAIQTGDLVLFSGKGAISAGIKWMTGSRWSHVGMALRLDEWDMVLLWESTTLSNIADITSGKLRQGVQLSPLSRRIATYPGEVAIRHLEVERTPAMHQALRRLRETVKGRPYESDKLELLKSAYDGPWGGTGGEDLSTLFCSELIAEAYQCMGLLPESPPSNEYTPGDFTEKAELPLLKGRLGPALPVTTPAAQPYPDAALAPA